MKKDNVHKTEVELMIGRRISSLYEILKLNHSPGLQRILGSDLRSVAWQDIPASLGSLDPAEAYQIGQLSALYRLGLDIRHLTSRPLVVRGKVVSNPWKVPVQEVGAGYEAGSEIPAEIE